MFIYLIFAPLATAFLLLGYHRVLEKEILLRPLIVGAAAYLPAWVIRLIIAGLVEEAHTGAALYLQALLFDHLVPILLALGLFYLLAGQLREASQSSYLVGMGNFLGAYFTMEALLYLALGPDLVTPYELFLAPTLRLLVILLLPLLVSRLQSSLSFDRYVLAAGALLGLGALPVVTFLYAVNFYLISYLATALLILVSLSAYLSFGGGPGARGVFG